MLKIGSLYAGVGGIDLAFTQAGFDISWSNEWDKNSCKTFRLNFDHTLYEEDVWKLDPKELTPIDVLVAGFPCQAFSVAGYRKGFSDHRGNHFFRIMDYITIHNPKVIFLENVKNLKGHDKGKTFRVIKQSLIDSGYKVFSNVLNTRIVTDIPQNRERIYIVAFRSDLYDDSDFLFPDPSDEIKEVQSLIDKEVSEEFFYTDRFLHYEKLKETIKDPTTFYQWRRQYVRENKSNACPTLTANMGTGGHNVPLILSENGIRKLTPRECFRFQGFPEDFKLPDLANSHLYKQAGNSVSVPVIKLIAQNIFKKMNELGMLEKNISSYGQT